jgi:plastocyanin
VLRWWADVVLVASLALLSSSEAASQSGTATRTHSVAIENIQFSPAVLLVHRGDRIVWLNKDLFPHTVTATGKAFDSGSIEPGGSWTYAANKVGEFSYGCIFHPTMKGSLRVQ